MVTAHAETDETISVLTPANQAWATLLASLPETASATLARLGGIAGILAAVRYDAESRPVAMLTGQRRPESAMMRLVLLWTAGPANDTDLLAALERQALTLGIFCLRADTEIARRLGDGAFASREGFYERWLGARRALNANHPPPPYPQTTGFTCGPASLAMGLAGFDPAIPLERKLEIELWREATTIVGLAGPGGCDPYGLALAAHRRGLEVEILMSSAAPILLDRAATEQKRGLMEFVQTDFKRQAELADIPLYLRPLAIDEIRAALERGYLALVLIDQMAMMAYSAPHWVLVHGYRDGLYFLNDPWIEPARFEQPADVFDIPVAGEALDRMAWYGEPAYRAALFIRPAPAVDPRRSPRQ